MARPFIRPVKQEDRRRFVQSSFEADIASHAESEVRDLVDDTLTGCWSVSKLVAYRGLSAFIRHGQLPATGGNVDAAALSDRARNLELISEDALKFASGVGTRGGPFVTRCRIQRNEIHLGRRAVQQRAHRSSVSG